MLAPLASRTFRALFAAQVIALLGTGVATVGLALLADSLAGEGAGAVLGTALALKMIAYVTVAPAVGGFAHRLPRRGLLVGLNLGRAALVLCLPFVSAVWQVYALIFLLSALAAGYTPVFQAAIPDILPEERTYTQALSLSRLAYDLENLASPLLAGAALAYLTYDALFVANGAAFAAAALLVLSAALPASAAEAESESPWRTLTFGLRAYLKTPRLRGLFALSLAVAAAGAMVIVNTVVLVRHAFGGTASHVAFAFAAAGAGSMLTALLLPRLLDRWPDRPLMLAGGALLGGAMLLGPAATDYGRLLALWLVAGIGSSLVQTPAGRLLRRSSDDSGRAAVYAAQFALSHACWLLTYPLAGWLGSGSGMAAAFTALGVLALLGTGAAFALWPSADPVEIEHSHEAVEHEHLHVHGEHHQHPHEGWEGPEPHRHPHRHRPITHKHPFVIDRHHPAWPDR